MTMMLRHLWRRFPGHACWLLGLSVSLHAEMLPLPSGADNVVGSVTTVRSSAADTFVDIARRHGLGFTDLLRANPDVDPWLPGEGTELTLPTQFVLPDAPRRGIVLNLAEYRLYYYPPPGPDGQAMVITYPISIGRQDWATPLGDTRIVEKVVRPSWYVPQSVHQERREAGDPPLPAVVPPGPDNPLGSRKMRLGIPGYLIHGTNRPAGVGMRVTHGCIRMFPEDIEVFFEQVPIGTPVRIVNQPIKFGWDGDTLLVEAHELLASAPQQTEDTPGADTVVAALPDQDPASLSSALTEMMRRFVDATAERRVQPDWPALEAVVAEARGVPTRVAASPPPETETGVVAAD